MYMLIVSKVLLYDPRGKLLVLFRSSTHPLYPHEVDFPGGEVDPDETPQTALVRELWEETGIIIRKEALTHIYTHDLTGEDRQDQVFKTHISAMPSGIKLSWEHESYEWIDPRYLFTGKRYQGRDSYLRSVLMALSRM